MMHLDSKFENDDCMALFLFYLNKGVMGVMVVHFYSSTLLKKVLSAISMNAIMYLCFRKHKKRNSNDEDKGTGYISH